MSFFLEVMREAWNLLNEAGIFILFGIFVAALIKMFISPESVAKHLAEGRVKSVFKAALLGVPLPLCSCGVLPVGASLKKQGANNGATTAFLIATPESGVDSMAVTYALMDPLMTVIRPVAAMVTAVVAGLTENFMGKKPEGVPSDPDRTCPVDGCCDGHDCSPEDHLRHHSYWEKFTRGMTYAFGDLWRDIAPWFFIGIVISGVIAAWVPDDALSGILGGGMRAMLVMLLVGIPLYICATASTPIAATLILKGISPGAALVFLLVGPATNATSLTVLVKILGRRGTAIYLVSLAACALLFGVAADWIYSSFGLSAPAMIGQATKMFPAWLQMTGAICLIGLSLLPLVSWLKNRFKKEKISTCASCCQSGH